MFSFLRYFCTSSIVPQRRTPAALAVSFICIHWYIHVQAFCHGGGGGGGSGGSNRTSVLLLWYVFIPSIYVVGSRAQ